MAQLITDISKHNGSVNMTKLSSKVKGVIIRAGYRTAGTGRLATDPMFESHLKKAEAAKLPLGVYWYTTSVSEAEGKAEAEYLLKLVKGHKLSFPLFLDLEYYNTKREGRADNLSKAKRTKYALAFLNAVEKAGYAAGIYCNKDFWSDSLENAKLRKYARWIARYGETCGVDCDIWQYTSSAKGSSYGATSEHIDLSKCYTDFIGGKKSKFAADNVKYDIVETGTAVTAYMVKVTANVLNIRSGPGTNYTVTGKITDKGSYTIIMESSGTGATKWGKLKSGVGWIALDYTEKVKSNLVTVSGSKVTLNGKTLTVWNQHQRSGKYKEQLSSSGCGLCTCAMAAVLAGVGTTPEKVVELAVKKWGKAKDGHWCISGKGMETLLKSYGVSSDYELVTKDNLIRTKALIKTALEAGHPVACWTDDNGLKDDPFSSGEHWVLAVGYDKDGKIVVANSGNKGPVNLVTLDTLTKFLKANCVGGATGWYTSVAESAGIVIVK